MMLCSALMPSNGVLAMVALGFGYIVCSLAKKETGILRIAGYFSGISIMVMSSIIILVKVACVTGICPTGDKLPMP